MRRERVIWNISCVVAAIGLTGLVYELWWDKGLPGILLLAPTTLVVGLTLLVLAFLAGRRAASRSLLLLLTVCVLALGVYRWRSAGNFVRFETRWLLHRTDLRQEVLSNPDPEPGLAHIHWDDWGMAGQGTESYLVFDPSDRLRYATRVREGRHSAELPCDVWQIWRLEPHWYSVVFYSDAWWPDPRQESPGSSPC